MFNLILKFFVFIFALGTVLECLYNFPIMALDITLIGFTVFLYYLFRTLRVLNRITYTIALIAGIIISGINFLPIKTPKSHDLRKYVNEKGIIEIILKGNIYKDVRKDFKAKSMREFVGIARIYYTDFFLKYFYLIFLVAFFLSEIVSRRLWFKEKKISEVELV